MQNKLFQHRPWKQFLSFTMSGLMCRRISCSSNYSDGAVDVLVVSKKIQLVLAHPLSSKIWACIRFDMSLLALFCLWPVISEARLCLAAHQHGSLCPLLGRFIICQVLGVVWGHLQGTLCKGTHPHTIILPNQVLHLLRRSRKPWWTQSQRTHHPALRSVTTLIALTWLVMNISYKISCYCWLFFLSFPMWLMPECFDVFLINILGGAYFDRPTLSATQRT